MTLATRITAQHHTLPDLTGRRQVEGGLRLRGGARQRSAELPLVTVITVCWNAARTLEAAMRSVFGQSYDNIEYIVIDGGSQDGSVELLRAHEARIDYFVSEPDDGLYHAMNKGLSLAQGDCILMLNADDWYEPDTVARLVAARQYSGCDFIGGLARYINADGSSHVLRSMPFDHSVMLRMPLRHETMLIPAELYDRVGCYNTEYPIIADYELTIRLFKAGARYYEVAKPLLNFSTGGVSNTARERLDAETRQLMRQFFPFLSDADLLAMTDHGNLGPETFIGIANAHTDQPEFLRAVRALIKDRAVHSGPRWKAAPLDDLAAGNPLARPKVSVIIPCHNNETTVSASVQGALQQSLREIEVICINDGSSDGSRDVLEGLARTDERVRVLDNDRNRGPGFSRNAGITAARGDYLFFLDADDAIAPGALERLHSVARQHQSCIVRGALRVEQTLHGRQGTGAIKFAANVTAEPLVNTTLHQTPALLATTEGHYAALYDADFVQAHPYPEDLRVGEDSLFTVRAYAATSSITVLPDVVYHYLHNADSAMNRQHAAKYFDGLRWRSRAWAMLVEAGHRNTADDLLFNFWSEAYFDGLEAALGTDEKQRYFSILSSLFADAGAPDARLTCDPALRKRLHAMLEHSARIENAAEAGLRIATLSVWDHGGAGLGSQRRVEALRRAGLNAEIHCLFRKTAHAHVHALTPVPGSDGKTMDGRALNEAWHAAAVVSRAEVPALSAQEMVSKTGSVVDFRTNRAALDQADIVHLHWVAGIFDYANADVLADRPVAWTLADMNAFTGGCHYAEGCEKFRQDCRECPLLGGADLAHQNWKIKRDAYAKLHNLHIICPSKWLAERARESALFKDRPVHFIPNALPVDRFRPTNRVLARRHLGLPLDRKLVLFGADSLTNQRKGGDLLARSLGLLRARGLAQGVEGLVFGANALDLGMKVHSMGHVQDEARMAMIYAAADVFAFPSREDNAPLTVVESMLSGTPVVGFGVGNVPELVRHLETGYIARYADTGDFAEGLAWALRDAGSAEALLRGLRAHLHARAHNDPEVSASRHLALYSQMLEQEQLATAEASGKQPGPHRRTRDQDLENP
ncbi:MAG: glycosyltransferase [Pararhodobacter sp.]